MFVGLPGASPQSWPNFSKNFSQMFETFSPKNRYPQKLVHWLLCREMTSVCNAPPRWTLCAEGAGQQPPKYDCHFCEKVPNTSALPLTVLECSYRNLPSDRIFSIYHLLADGGESMWISAPYPEIGAPKVGKMWGLVQTAYAYFVPVCWLVNSLSEVLLACKISDGGVTSFERYAEKTGLLHSLFWAEQRCRAAAAVLRPPSSWLNDQWHITFRMLYVGYAST